MTSARNFKMPYGKYKGETLEEIYVEDIGYLEWLLDEYSKRTAAPRGGWAMPSIEDKIKECFKEMRNVRICE